MDIKPFIRWLISHSRKGVAFLILDHTNAEGDLQGSITKRRAADLGILLEKLEQNEINVSYQFDRYGVESKSSPHTLMPCFTSSEFRLKLSTEPQQEPEEKKLNTRLELYAYLLVLEAQGKTPSEIVAQTKMKRATVDNYLNAFKPESELTKSQKKSRRPITPEDKELVFVEKERLMKLTDDELAQRLEDFQNSELSRLFQG